MFTRRGVHKSFGNVIVHGFFQVGSLESGCDPQAVVELPTGKIELVNVDNIIFEVCAPPEAVVPQNKICRITRDTGTWILEVDNRRIRFKNETGEASEYFAQHYQKLGYRVEMHTLLT